MSEFLLTVSNFIYGNTGVTTLLMFLICGSNLGLPIFMLVSERDEGRLYIAYVITVIINLAFFVLALFALFSCDDEIGHVAIWSAVPLLLAFWPSLWILYSHTQNAWFDSI